MNGDLKKAWGCAVCYVVVWFLLALASLAGAGLLLYALIHYLLTH